jgi:hypothetical protein
MLVGSIHATTLYNSLLFSSTLDTTTITFASGHGKQCWWGPCCRYYLLSTTLYNSMLLFTILYYYLLLFTILCNYRLFSATLGATTITTAGGHDKQCWWGPCMPLLSTILYYSLLLSLPLLLLLLEAMASNAGGVHACHYYDCNY